MFTTAVILAQELKGYNNKHFRSNMRAIQASAEAEKKKSEKTIEKNRQYVIHCRAVSEGVKKEGAQYFCAACDTHISPEHLEWHLETANHKKWCWKLPEEDKQQAISEGLLLATMAEDGHWYVSHQNGQKKIDSAWWCHPCQKEVTNRQLKQHIDSNNHKKKKAWVDEETCQPCTYADPVEEFLVWRSDDDSSAKWLYCLLCQKYTNDEVGEQHGLNGGTKDHTRHLANHYLPRSPWYRANVVPYTQQRRSSLATATDEAGQKTKALRQAPRAMPYVVDQGAMPYVVDEAPEEKKAATKTMPHQHQETKLHNMIPEAMHGLNAALQEKNDEQVSSMPKICTQFI